MKSLWKTSAEAEISPRLTENITTEVLIVGGGIAGLLCAYRLSQTGTDCVVVEADTIGSGTTGNSTAKITFQHSLIYDKLIKQRGTETAKKYLEIQKKACTEYEKLCKAIDCGYEKKDSYVYSLSDREKIEKEVSAYLTLGEEAEFVESTLLPFSVAGAVRIRDQAQFDPVKFICGIKENLRIYEHTRVKEFLPGRAVTKMGEIKYKKVIIATHFPIINKHGGYFLKMYQHRSYVIALTGAQDVNGMYVDEYEKGMSFRNYKDYLLIGGGDHRTGKKGGNLKELEEFSKRHYPSAQIRYRWAAQDCITLDGIPYIGRYSEKTPDMLVATGFNKWGFSSAMAAAIILCDMVNEKENEYADVFYPSRSILHPGLFVNIFEAITGLLTPGVPRCPHMGCALRYNPYEHSWDCTCHGSRFTENGELIDNPATDGIKKLKG